MPADEPQIPPDLRVTITHVAEPLPLAAKVAQLIGRCPSCGEPDLPGRQCRRCGVWWR